MSRAKESRTIRHVEVFDTPSNMGGSFTVSIVRELDAERVEVRVWYGRPTPMGWEPWKDWDATGSKPAVPPFATLAKWHYTGNANQI